MTKILLVATAISGFLSVLLGAFGAHGLKGKIADNLLAAYQTGVQYHMFHTLALLILAVLMWQLSTVSRWLSASAICWLLGILLFSGSLYWLALGGPRWLGPITPLGGVLLMMGWVSMAVGVLQSN